MKDYIRRFLRAKELSLPTLAEKLGYKSKTSLDRIMSGSIRKSSLKRFESAMLAAFPLTAEEKVELHDAVRIAQNGRSAYLIEKEMWAILQGDELSQGDELMVYHADTGEELNLRARLLEAKNVFATVLNCQYVVSLFKLLREILDRDDTQVRHYLYVNQDQVRTIRAIHALMPLLYQPGYQVFACKENQTDNFCGMNEADVAVLNYQTTDGFFEQDLLVFQSPHSASLLTLPGYNAFSAQALFLKDKSYSSIKITYPKSETPEDYIRYSSEAAELEYNRSVWKIKPDICLDLIPPPVLEAAMLRGAFGHQPDARYLEAIAPLRQVYLKRFQNTFSKKKHCFTLLKRGAMNRFVCTGRTTDHFWGMDCFTPEERVQVLQELLHQQNENPYVHIYFLENDDTVRDIELVYYEGKGMLMLETDTNYRLTQQADVMLVHQELQRLFPSFFVNVLVKEHALPESQTPAILNELIQKVKRLNYL